MLPLTDQASDTHVETACVASSSPVAGAPMILHARVITGAGGGPDKTILNSPRFLTQLGYRCTCAFLRQPSDDGFQSIRERAIRWQAPIEEIDDRGAFDWRVFPQLLQLCRKLKVDVWHAHDYKTNLIGIILQRLHPMRLVTTAHGWVEYTPRTRIYYQFDRWSLPKYERVICVSEDLKETCRNYGVADNRCVLIENAVDVEQFRRLATVDAAKARMGRTKHRYLIGAVGRLSAEKAFDVLIRAVHELVRRGIDVELAIAGEGPQRGELERLIQALGLQEYVQLLGFRSDLRHLYEALDLFVLSSIREGLPNAVLEAMSLQVPVVATRIAGIPRLISDGENGLLVPPSDAVLLADSIERALTSPTLRARLAESGRRTVEDRYSFIGRMKKVAALYDELLNNTNGAPK
jgi:glycosyltransferase involved in cell wall biosynthesis